MSCTNVKLIWMRLYKRQPIKSKQESNIPAVLTEHNLAKAITANGTTLFPVHPVSFPVYHLNIFGGIVVEPDIFTITKFIIICY